MITVAKVKETSGKTAIVEAERKSACAGCHKQSDGQGCSVCGLLGGNAVITAKAKNTVGAKVGDTVEIESSSGKMLLYALLIFVIPILAAVAAYFVASNASEGTRLLFAGGAFALVFLADALISRATGKNRCDINIVKIINNI